MHTFYLTQKKDLQNRKRSVRATVVDLANGVVQMGFGVLWVTLWGWGGHLPGQVGPKLPGNERFSSSPFQRMSKLSQRIIFGEVTAI